MIESCKDIGKYLSILQNEVLQETSSNDDLIIINEMIGNMYTVDDGIRWIKIIDEKDDTWLIEHGYIEHEADGIEYLSKSNLSHMIITDELKLLEIKELEYNFIVESIDDNKFEKFMDKVERYILINERHESSEYTYNWREAWEQGLTSSEAAEEAIILNG